MPLLFIRVVSAWFREIRGNQLRLPLAASAMRITQQQRTRTDDTGKDGNNTDTTMPLLFIRVVSVWFREIRGNQFQLPLAVIAAARRPDRLR